MQGAKPSELFIEAVRSSNERPSEVRLHAHDARAVEESSFDESYIEFLDEQIRLNARGPEWREILRWRRDGLRSFCHVSLLSGHVSSGRYDTWIEVDPKKKAVVFWEQLKYDDAA
jgi:hypothetical protein